MDQAFPAAFAGMALEPVASTFTRGSRLILTFGVAVFLLAFAAGVLVGLYLRRARQEQNISVTGTAGGEPLEMSVPVSSGCSIDLPCPIVEIVDISEHRTIPELTNALIERAVAEGMLDSVVSATIRAQAKSKPRGKGGRFEKRGE